MKRKRRGKKKAAAPAAPQPAEPEDAGAPVGRGGGKRKLKRARKAEEQEEVPAEPIGEDEESEDDDDDDEDEDEEEGEEEAEDGDLDVDFEFFDPNEDDYHSVGDLIKNGTWEFVELNFAELADSIVGQGNIGTLIKSDADAGSAGTDKEETVCGMLTTLNLRQFAHQSWPKAMGNALLEKAKKHADAEVVQKLRGLLERKDGSEVGLLLSERFVNLPPQLIPPLHRALQEDIEWSCSTPECPPEERPFYGFTHFLGVARCFEAPPASAAAGSAAGGGPRGKKRRRAAAAAAAAAEPSAGAAAAGGGPAFPHPEDEAYVKRAFFSFTFPMPSAATEKRSAAKGKGAMRGRELRSVFALTRKAFERVVKEIGADPAFSADGGGGGTGSQG